MIQFPNLLCPPNSESKNDFSKYSLEFVVNKFYFTSKSYKTDFFLETVENKQRFFLPMVTICILLEFYLSVSSGSPLTLYNVFRLIVSSVEKFQCLKFYCLEGRGSKMTLLQAMIFLHIPDFICRPKKFEAL